MVCFTQISNVLIGVKLGNIRQLIRSVLLEDDETLKKWAVKGKDAIDIRLAEIGIFPIPRGNKETSQFANGASNSVREVVYDGKRAVARISNDENEVRALQNLIDFKDRVDPKFAKHFPIVYTTFEFMLSDAIAVAPSSNESKTIYGAVVEYLDPLPPTLVHDINWFEYDKNLPSARVERAANIEAFKPFIRRIHSTRKEEAIRLISKHVIPIMQKGEGLSTDAVLRMITKEFSKIKDIDVELAIKIKNDVERVLRASVIPFDDDRGHQEDNVMLYQADSIKEFYVFLRALSKAGLSWQDLHTQNFMVRPSTGDFVIVDPGLFNT